MTVAGCQLPEEGFVRLSRQKRLESPSRDINQDRGWSDI